MNRDTESDSEFDPASDSNSEADLRTVVQATYLSKRPDPNVIVVILACLLTMIVASQIYWSDWGGLAKNLAASPNSVFKQGQIWRLLSTLFVHADYGHLLSNGFLFYIFGYFVGGHFGFKIFPLGTLIFGAIINVLVLLTYSEHINLIGMSGVVYFLGGFWLILYVLIDRRRNLKERGLRAIGTGLILFFPTTFAPEISYRAHAIGFALGMVAGASYFLRHKKEIRRAEILEIVS